MKENMKENMKNGRHNKGEKNEMEQNSWKTVGIAEIWK